jgi:enoyl-CoA hydratase/carnithine racemase
MYHYKHIIIAAQGPILRITLNRPEALNALNEVVHQELSIAFDHYASDSKLCVAVIRGIGERAFCTGSDLKERAVKAEASTYAGGYAGLLQRFDLHKPIIAAVNGHAIGGGLEIVLACDLAISVAHAKFGLPEPRVGLVATGGLHRLARSIPLKHAMHIASSGRLFSAAKALDYGLINAVVDPDRLDAEVEQSIEEILAGTPLAIMAIKQMML